MRNLGSLIVALVIISAGCSRSAQKYLESGKSKYDRYDYFGALDDYGKALEKDPRLAEAYYSSGMVLSAIRENSIGISVVRKDVGAPAPRGTNLPDLDVNQEILDYSRAITLDPAFAAAYYRRGLARIAAGRKDSVCIDFKKAVELGSTDALTAMQDHCK